MIGVIVEIRTLREIFPARPGRVDTKPGDRVLVATQNGLEEGIIIESEKMLPQDQINMKIIRILNDDDYRIMKENKEKMRKILPDIIREIEDEKLDMKLASISYTYDRQKLFIYYTASERVDFRNLIRALGSRLKVRIQMVQIGVRDAASIMGGLGVCGREVCCHCFLRDIESVNIDMARCQQLSLNPENISGCCGRLLCCLRYENDFYEDTIKRMPQIGRKVNTPEGRGEVVSVNCMKETVMVKLRSGVVSEFRASEVRSGVKDTLKKLIK